MFFHAVFLFPCFLIAAAWASACDYPELPTDLELITAVEATDVREVHLHGMYSIGADAFDYAAKKFVHNLTLQYPAVQRFRVAIQPHDATDLDIRLVMTDDGKMVHCSVNGQQAVERMIFAMLQPNVKYTLQVRYTTSSNGVMCPRLMMELASQPDAQAVSFKESCDDSEAPVIPAIFPKSETEYYFEYKSAEDTFVTLGGTDDKERFSQVGRYPIRVPHIAGRHQRWKFKAEIQARFLDGGDFVFVITPKNVSSAPSPANCTDVGCITGERALRNRFIVQTILWGGQADLETADYWLWLLRRRPEVDIAATCAPLAFHIALFPLKEEETFVSCDVDPLPDSFHYPGMYDNDTFSMTTLVRC